MIDDDKLNFHVHQLAHNRTIEVSHEEHRFLLRLKEPGLTVLFITKESTKSGHLPAIASLTIVAVLLIIILTYHMVRRLFQPIEIIRQSVAHFGSGDLKHRITLQRRDELGELAKSVNTMADELQAMLEAKRQLLLAISHELRSPLARIRLNAELLDTSTPRDRIIDDLHVLEHQLTELLETEKLESKHTKLDLQPVDPLELIESVINEHFKNSDWQSHFDSRGSQILLDAARTKLMIRNLLDNARRHNPKTEKPINILSELTADGWHFQVSDHGEGIGKEHLEHLTEPFYRVDRARQRVTGGYGLGLYLCRVITEAHGGKLTIQSEQGVGTQVAVYIPYSSKS
jgi:signal transduction histidine kinase